MISSLRASLSTPDWFLIINHLITNITSCTGAKLPHGVMLNQHTTLTRTLLHDTIKRGSLSHEPCYSTAVILQVSVYNTGFLYALTEEMCLSDVSLVVCKNVNLSPERKACSPSEYHICHKLIFIVDSLNSKLHQMNVVVVLF